jgi:hypothetical protein
MDRARRGASRKTPRIGMHGLASKGRNDGQGGPLVCAPIAPGSKDMPSAPGETIRCRRPRAGRKTRKAGGTAVVYADGPAVKSVSPGAVSGQWSVRAIAPKKNSGKFPKSALDKKTRSGYRRTAT